MSNSAAGRQCVFSIDGQIGCIPCPVNFSSCLQMCNLFAPSHQQSPQDKGLLIHYAVDLVIWTFLWCLSHYNSSPMVIWTCHISCIGNSTQYCSHAFAFWIIVVTMTSRQRKKGSSMASLARFTSEGDQQLKPTPFEPVIQIQWTMVSLSTWFGHALTFESRQCDDCWSWNRPLMCYHCFTWKQMQSVLHYSLRTICVNMIPGILSARPMYRQQSRPLR